jgi:hypothetical protein
VAIIRKIQQISVSFTRFVRPSIARWVEGPCAAPAVQFTDISGDCHSEGEASRDDCV